MKLRDLLAALPDELRSAEMQGDRPAFDLEVKGLCTNSHACQPGDVFIGMPGTRVDGGEFWAGAIAAGAIAAIVSPSAFTAQPPTDQDCVLSVPSMAVACATLASAFYGHPARQLKLVGVTGTNGKTTTTHLIEFLLTHGAAATATALFGTLYARWPGHQTVATHTTPFAVDLHQQFAAAIAAGCQLGVMEVSSHALAQQRVLGCPFEAAVFTNLTQDHLDYHHDLDDYFNAKATLFTPAYLQGRAIVNRDDPYGRELVQRLGDRPVWTYSTQSDQADLWTSDLIYGADGVQGQLHTPSGTLAFASPLVGQFNLANLLAAVGAALHLGVDLGAIAATLPQFAGVPGRMERVQVTTAQDISVIVDYAHTPDSLDNMLRAARPFIAGQMICVFGCGGDRDRTKRPQMGAIAANLADQVIVTSDNPRTEIPDRILEDIVAGIPAGTTYQVEGDRAIAIHTAIRNAQPGDGILIAGKGHEDYQILGTEKVHFDDREQAREALSQRYGA